MNRCELIFLIFTTIANTTFAIVIRETNKFDTLGCLTNYIESELSCLSCGGEFVECVPLCVVIEDPLCWMCLVKAGEPCYGCIKSVYDIIDSCKKMPPVTPYTPPQNNTLNCIQDLMSDVACKECAKSIYECLPKCKISGKKDYSCFVCLLLALQPCGFDCGQKLYHTVQSCKSVIKEHSTPRSHSTSIPVSKSSQGSTLKPGKDNPFLYPCTMDNQCTNSLQQCFMDAGPNSKYWFCNAYCGGAFCNQNGDCATNICINNLCTSTGGKQGSLCGHGCSNDSAQCDPNYVCQPWGLTAGYCDYKHSTPQPSTRSMPISKSSKSTSLSTLGPDTTNPFLYSCSSDSQCNNSLSTCAIGNGPNSTYWYCAAFCGGSSCNRDEDCATNICSNGVCTTSGGTQGCQCGGICPNDDQCASGYICQKWGSIGYCDYANS